MATFQSLTPSPSTVAPNGTVTWTATFAMSAGGTDETLTGELRDAAGVVVGTSTVVLDRPGDEPNPTGLTFRVRNAAGTTVGTAGAVSGVRTSPTLYTVTIPWTAPAS